MEKVDNTQEMQTPVTNEQKLQYENQQLKAMLDRMGKQMTQMDMVNIFKRLEFLFKVIENKDAFSKDFTAACIEEIEARMSLDQEEEKEETDNTPQ